MKFIYLIARGLNLQNGETRISLQKTHQMIDYAYSQIYCAPRHFGVEKHLCLSTIKKHILKFKITRKLYDFMIVCQKSEL